MELIRDRNDSAPEHVAQRALEAIVQYSPGSIVRRDTNEITVRYDHLIRTAVIHFAALSEEERIKILSAVESRHALSNTFGIQATDNAKQKHYDRALYYIYQHCPGLEQRLAKEAGVDLSNIPKVTRKLFINQGERDHVVVKDFKSAKGFTVMTLAELKKKYPLRSHVLLATRGECEEWINTPGERTAIEKWSELQHSKRVALPSEQRVTTPVQKVLEKFSLPVQTSLFQELPKPGNGMKM